MGENVVISIDNVVKRFPVGGSHFTALKNIDLTLHKGEFTGLIGPSGSGKTTLLNIIGGLDSATNGAVRVLEQSMDNTCLLYTSPSPRDPHLSRMPSSA